MGSILGSPYHCWFGEIGVWGHLHVVLYVAAKSSGNFAEAPRVVGNYSRRALAEHSVPEL